MSPVRREFLRSGLAASALVLGARSARAAGLMTYSDVDPALFKGINRVQDPTDESLLAQKHAPVIQVPDQIAGGKPFPVTVTVGKVIHPMSWGHHIQYVQLLAGNEPAGRVDLDPEVSVPRVTFTIKLPKPVTLVVREYCNLHGLWESRLDVKPS